MLHMCLALLVGCCSGSGRPQVAWSWPQAGCHVQVLRMYVIRAYHTYIRRICGAKAAYCRALAARDASGRALARCIACCGRGKCDYRGQIALCDPQGGGEEQFGKRKFCEILPPWGAVVPAMQHAARQHKQAITGVKKLVKKIKEKCTHHLNLDLVYPI